MNLFILYYCPWTFFKQQLTPMENQKLYRAFLDACLARQIFSIRNEKGVLTRMIDRSHVRSHIPNICREIGIPVEHNDVLTLITDRGTLDESRLISAGKATRSTLTTALIGITIRSGRSATLPSFETVNWIHHRVKEIERERHRSDCREHWNFLDWYHLVKIHIFLQVPIPVADEAA
ncbi:hypothetical protein H7X65_00310 [Candidatus Parcubacteria bacterium]|nr:hypothetical protein [Candidatus Parcubacteria bacterium]